MLMVVAALIQSDGKLLICQRRQGGPFELLWEFPGGKKKPNETLKEALARELHEELGVAASIGREVYRTCHKYPEMVDSIEIIFFRAIAARAQIQNRVFEKIEWRSPELLGELNFLPADRELIEKLVTGALHGKLVEPEND